MAGSRGLVGDLVKGYFKVLWGEGMESEETGSTKCKETESVTGKGGRGVTTRQKPVAGQGGCPGGFLYRLQYCLREGVWMRDWIVVP